MATAAPNFDVMIYEGDLAVVVVNGVFDFTKGEPVKRGEDLPAAKFDSFAADIVKAQEAHAKRLEEIEAGGELGPCEYDTGLIVFKLQLADEAVVKQPVADQPGAADEQAEPV